MKSFFTFVLALLFVLCLRSAELTGKVIKVYDGDTIRVQDTDGGKFKIRFSDIDAPEKTQVCGEEAKVFLNDMVSGKIVKVKFLTIDQYGRIVGTVYIDDNISVNETLVRSGFAWWYKSYSKNPAFGKLESEARSKKIGIWKEANPIPPWQYRKEQKAKKGANK